MTTTQEKLQSIFPEPFQVKRIMRQLTQIREAKEKHNFWFQFTIVRGKFVILNFECKLSRKQRPLEDIQKVQFQIIVKKDYPLTSPDIFFSFERMLEIGIRPFYNYSSVFIPEWHAKCGITDVVKIVIDSLATPPARGKPERGKNFAGERIFSWVGCKTFPLKLRQNDLFCPGLLVFIEQDQVVLLQEGDYTGSYLTCDFISAKKIVGLSKHKVYSSRFLIELKINRKKFAVELMSEDYETVTSALAELIKPGNDDENSDSQPPRTPESPLNLELLEEEIAILESKIDCDPTNSLISELIELLKKAVEHYSAKGSEKFNIYLKKMQEIMRNQDMQAILASAEESKAISQKYMSITDMF